MIDPNARRFVGEGEDIIASLENLPEPSSITELLIAGGLQCGSQEEIKSYLRGLWDWGKATDTIADSDYEIVMGLHDLGIITADEYSGYLYSRTTNPN